LFSHIIRLTSLNYSQPSIAPVPNPSCYPTGFPTKFNAHTGKPSIKGQSYSPSSRPTQAPVRDLEAFFNNSLYNTYINIKSGLKNSVVFSTFTYKDVTILNKCANWLYFTENALTLPFTNLDISAINLVVMNENLKSRELSKINVTCSDFTKANYISAKVAKGEQFLVSCGGHFWRQLKCSGKKIFS
jgi:hypothetical protein